MALGRRVLKRPVTKTKKVAASGRKRALGAPRAPSLAQRDVERLRRQLRVPVERGRWPGVAAAVYVGGRLELLEEAGYADVEAGTPMTKDSLVRVYSMTKCVIAAAVMQLVEARLLGLDDELGKHLPAFSHMRVVLEGADGKPDWDRVVPASRPIRIRHLLTHTSGISSGLAPGIDGPKVRSARERAWCEIYGPLVRAVDSGSIRDLGQWVGELAKLPLFSHPGQLYGYGYSYDILGHLVEVKTGRKLVDYLAERVFRPLGMRDTRFDATSAGHARRLSALYRCTRSPRFGGNGRSLRLARVDPPRRGAPSRWQARCRVPSGGGALTSLEGGLLSTLSDYSKFLLAVVSGGKHPESGARILTPSSAEQMLTDQTALLAEGGKLPPRNANPYNDRGLGLSCLGELQRRGAPAWGRWFDGVPGVRLWGGAASSAFKYDPNGGRPILAVVMTQVFPQEDGTVISTLLKGVREGLRGGAAGEA